MAVVVVVETGYGIAGQVEAMKLCLVVVASGTAEPAVGSSCGRKVVGDQEEIRLAGGLVVEVEELDWPSTERVSNSWLVARE